MKKSDPKDSQALESGKKDSGKQSDNPNGNQPDPNVKALQQKLTEKDKQIKEIQNQLDQTKKDVKKQDLESFTKKIDEMNQTISGMQKEKRINELSEAYPDISPNLLVDISDENLENVVKEQRKIAKKHYKGAEIFKTPQFSSKNEIDKKIDSIKKDAKMGGIKKATEIMKLTRLRDTHDF